MSKKRADIFLVDNGYCETRSKAQRLIMAGVVLANEVPVAKSSQVILDTDTIRIKEKIKYVSRGAFKLEKALEAFEIDVVDKTFVDFGASTGGFTDVLLQNGAAHVTCVDVGYGQLAWKIRNDKRVTVMERTNARYLTEDMICGRKDGAVCDVSFISVKKIIPAMELCTNDDGFIVILIKPQFEAGRESVGKKGIVRDKKVHIDVITKVIQFIVDETSFVPQKIDFSPIKGQKGNIEYLLFAKKNAINSLDIEQSLKIVDIATDSL
jgi:23S rRNA (cytidine1920-2'-O)/16S rRNA (cytidine1409-2'-O)-methyltransferase